MWASISFVVGIVVGSIALFAVGRAVTSAGGPSEKPTALGWCALGLGLAALLAGVLMMVGMPAVSDARISIALMAAAMVVSVGAAIRRDRHWPTWVGLTAGAIPALFWVLFVGGELVGPPH
jgi:hypothetical protein